MKRFAVVGLMIAALAGCSSQSYIETSSGLSDNFVDKNAAARSRLTLALKYIEIENYQEAKINLDKAVHYSPDNADIYLAYAYYYQKVKERQQAEKAYLYALDLAPGDGNIHNNFGVFLCGIARFDEAEVEFLAAIAVPSYNQIANSYENAGRCALESGDSEKALSYLESSLAYAPQNLDVRLSIAELNYMLADFAVAKQQLTKYESVSKATARSLWLGFKIAEKQNSSAVAEVYSRQLLAQFPLAFQTQKYITNDY
ncbi:type IV pilus biogenesis/stability protein PilW [Moritella marina ATCC 15381]|uniref:Type IV pilus biogenesis/stability protein PilW n=1 Tax=Moritella marina ATCC 15381 TaxID=1202962 RepID=A0A5J6WNQ3_MORMI|nr:type IV pilus biogenesis/stability protein PilW [Moritella marina]QFI38941.1 type IV pilus biogenesis/stability protein PilW [Moritella marina ATCC 15381]